MTDTNFLNQLLNDVENGILIFDEVGKLQFANQIASKRSGISTLNDVGKHYSALFLSDIPNTALIQFITKTYSEKKDTFQQALPYRTRDGRISNLEVKSKYIQETDIFQSGKKTSAIIVYLTDSPSNSTNNIEHDILNRKYDQLEKAFLKSEEQNRVYKHNLKRLEWFKILMTGLIFVLFGILMVNTRRSSNIPHADLSILADDLSEGKMVKVQKEPFQKRIFLSGTLDPYQKIVLAAQSNGKIIRRDFKEGDIVEKDHILYELDRREQAKRVRTSRVNYMEILEKYNAVKSWNTGLEVMQAQRKFDLAKIGMANERQKLEETKKLFNKGIIPRIEYEQAQTAYKSKEYEFQNAKQSLEQIEARGNPDKLEVLRLQLSNAKEELDELERQYEATVIRAPVRGIVMLAVSDDGSTVPFKNEGDIVHAGDLMAMIGATDSYLISTMVGELVVNEIHLNQPVLVTSYALPGDTLHGEVQQIATSAVTENNLRHFPIQLVLPAVPDSIRKKIRLGMLAEAQILTDSILDALTLPVNAIFRQDGEFTVCVVDSTGKQEFVPVIIGYSDNEKVVIKSGLTDSTEVLIRTK
ncbi:HlyD family efflux transporter periplasmic adaptor subunit [candidate division KSB1 bacterium]|nr:HlyD family efflux transporter periplasmic adaptor subunit [candidate division KSB1 bacterium]